MLGWVGLDGCNGWVDGWMGGWMMDEVSSVDEVCSNFFFHFENIKISKIFEILLWFALRAKNFKNILKN